MRTIGLGATLMVVIGLGEIGPSFAQREPPPPPRDDHSRPDAELRPVDPSDPSLVMRGDGEEFLAILRTQAEEVAQLDALLGRIDPANVWFVQVDHTDDTKPSYSAVIFQKVGADPVLTAAFTDVGVPIADVLAVAVVKDGSVVFYINAQPTMIPGLDVQPPLP